MERDRSGCWESELSVDIEASDSGSGEIVRFVSGLRRKVSLTLGGGLPWSDTGGESGVAA